MADTSRPTNLLFLLTPLVFQNDLLLGSDKEDLPMWCMRWGFLQQISPLSTCEYHSWRPLWCMQWGLLKQSHLGIHVKTFHEGILSIVVFHSSFWNSEVSFQLSFHFQGRPSKKPNEVVILPRPQYRFFAGAKRAALYVGWSQDAHAAACAKC